MKDMTKVLDYERRKQLAIFKGQSLNLAGVIWANHPTLNKELNKDIICEQIFDLAQQLYDYGIHRGWV